MFQMANAHHVFNSLCIMAIFLCNKMGESLIFVLLAYDMQVLGTGRGEGLFVVVRFTYLEQPLVGTLSLAQPSPLLTKYR